MKLSIVTTLYRSAPHLEAFLKRAKAVASEFSGDDYEIIMVEDGSPDQSLNLALDLVPSNPALVLIELSRNFGHHKAMMTGLSRAQGDWIFLIDVDLEEPPELLLPFSARLLERSADVVYGVQDTRKGNWFERWSGRGFYALFNWLSGIDLPRDVLTARLMKRAYVDALLSHQEREVFLAGLWHITGFRQEPYLTRKESSSQTSYTLKRKISLLVNAVTSFSNRPLIAIFYLGVLISGVATGSFASLLWNWFFHQKPLSGWTSIMASIWLLGGLIISFIGVIGMYLAKVYSETKQRPYTLIRAIHRHASRDA